MTAIWHLCQWMTYKLRNWLFWTAASPGLKKKNNNTHRTFHFKVSKQSSVLTSNLRWLFSWLNIITPPIFEGQLFGNFSCPKLRPEPGNQQPLSFQNHRHAFHVWKLRYFTQPLPWRTLCAYWSLSSAFFFFFLRHSSDELLSGLLAHRRVGGVALRGRCI